MALHSNYFSTLFEADEDDSKIELSQFKAVTFADFHAWLYSCEFLDANGPMADAEVLEMVGGVESVWLLSQFLVAPAFGNLCMDRHFRQACETEPKHWMYASNIELVYSMTPEDSLPRKFTADQMNCLNPLKRYKEGGAKWLEWNTMLDRCPDLRADMEKQLVKNGTERFHGMNSTEMSTW